MPKLSFRFDPQDEGDFEALLRYDVDEAYFRGSLYCRPGGTPTMSVHRTHVHPILLGMTATSSWTVFRRERRHIREDGRAFTLFWFIHRGTVHITGPEGTRTTDAGSFVAMDSHTPFVAEYIPDADGQVVAMTVNVPVHVLDATIPHGLKLGLAYPFDSGEMLLCEGLFALLFRIGETLSARSSGDVVAQALAAMNRGLRDAEGDLRPRGIRERRLEQIRGFIDGNLYDSAISAGCVARHAGISVRYLHHLLRSAGTSLSDLIGRRRLEQAGTWLRDPAMRAVPIGRLSENAGFASPEHFSRSFRRAFGASPRRYRQDALAAVP